MNQQAYVRMEITKNDKIYSLSVPWGSTYQECYDALVEISNELVELSKKHKEEADKAKAQAAVEEPQGV